MQSNERHLTRKQIIVINCIATTIICLIYYASINSTIHEDLKEMRKETKFVHSLDQLASTVEDIEDTELDNRIQNHVEDANTIHNDDEPRNYKVEDASQTDQIT
jgi:hypothetical protein